LEKIYEKIVTKGASLSGISKHFFDWALQLSLIYDTPDSQNIFYKIQHKIADKLVYQKWRDATGGEVKGIISGAAAMQPKYARVFNAAGIPIKEGYGQTETSPVVSVNRWNKGGMKYGSVGQVIPHVSCKIADDGEILIKGPNVMMVYYKNPDLTKEVIDGEGWLHTGDIGSLDKEHFIKITDRKKELFKTTSGKYVAPQVIEQRFKESFFIEHIIAVGENRKFVSVLIVPAFEQIQKHILKQNIEVKSKHELADRVEVKKMFNTLKEEVNKHLSEHEKVKKVLILTDDFTIETGEITPTLKLKRKNIIAKYQHKIDELYHHEA
jgi:long-chain acyl-CoA synthetase